MPTLHCALQPGLRMTRTIWLATICLAVLGTLAAGKAVMTRAYSSVSEQPTDQATVGIGLTQDTLGKADRLEISYVRPEMPTASALQPAEPVIPVASVSPPAPSQIISRHWHDPNAIPSGTKPKQTKQTALDKKSKTDDRKTTQAADRSKPAKDPVKPCSRPGAVGDLLRSLKLSPACES
jgi:hypothetical protein